MVFTQKVTLRNNVGIRLAIWTSVQSFAKYIGKLVKMLRPPAEDRSMTAAATFNLLQPIVDIGLNGKTTMRLTRTQLYSENDAQQYKASIMTSSPASIIIHPVYQ